MTDDRDKRIARATELVAAQDLEPLREEFSRLHPADIAEVIGAADDEQKVRLFELLPTARASEVLEWLGIESQEEILDHLERPQVDAAVAELDTEGISDLLRGLPDDVVADVLRKIRADRKAELQPVLECPEESVGRLMSREVVGLRETMTAREAIAYTQEETQAESLGNLYTVDDAGRLTGLVRFRSLVFARPETSIRRLTHTPVVSVNINMDREVAARTAQRYGLPNLPVVDDQERLVGVVTFDDVYEILKEENAEDMYKIAGTAERRPVSEGILRKVGLRLPWLTVTLAGGVCSGTVMRMFGHTLQEAVSLAFFVPVIMGMAGNVSIQASTTLVRALATGEARLSNLAKLLARELQVGLLLGLSCGATAGLAAWLLSRDPTQTVNPGHIGLAVGMAMTMAIVVGSFTGTLIPSLCYRLGIDPAIAAGPFITTLNDITALSIYLSIASAMLVVLKG